MIEIRHCGKRLFDSLQEIVEVAKGDLAVKCPKCKRIVEYKFQLPRYRELRKTQRLKCSGCGDRLMDVRLEYNQSNSHEHADIAILCRCKRLNRIVFSGIAGMA